MKSRFGGCCVVVFLFIFGAFFAGIAGNTLLEYRGSDDWLLTTGVIQSSAVTSSTDSDGDTTYSANLTYLYTVNDQQYTGHRVDFSNISTSDSSDAEEIVARYPVEKSVTVYYNPDDPDESVLERTISNWMYGFLGIGLCVIGGAVLGTLYVGLRFLRGGW